MEQSHKNNTPTAKYYDTVLDAAITQMHSSDNPLSLSSYYSPPKQYSDTTYRDTINGFPVLVYYCDNSNLIE